MALVQWEGSQSCLVTGLMPGTPTESYIWAESSKKEPWKISSNIAHLLAFLSHACAFPSFSVSVTDPILPSCIIAYCSISHIPLSSLLPNSLNLLQPCSLLSNLPASALAALSSQMLLLQHSLLIVHLPIQKSSPLCFPIFKQALPLCKYPQHFIL